MPAQFNSYIDRIDTDFWKSLCIGQGEMRRYEKGDKFISAGTVGRYIIILPEFQTDTIMAV